MESKKYIHQIWFQGKHEIPNKYLKNIEKTKNKLSNWEHIIWDDMSIQALLKEKNIKYYNKYINYKFLHQKVDYARYIILYYYGGFYVDMDAYVTKDPSILFDLYPDYEIYVSSLEVFYYEKIIYLQYSDIINNGVILALPKSQLMLDLINHCPEDFIFKSKTININNTTGPAIFSKFVARNNKIKILSREYFEPCRFDICDITDNTMVIHIHELSWMNNIVKYIFQSYIKYRNYVNFIINIILIYILYIVSQKILAKILRR
tara:strand:+ start:5840 stop:6625 length:786 start_codon:yes stop_codon:yes gene_type:complete